MAKIEIYAKPTWLYRYRSLRKLGEDRESRADRDRLNRELSAIERGRIYCGTFDYMNDPMEGFYRPNAHLKDQASNRKLSDRVLSEKLGLGVASLSETWDNELMWAHYADGFRGICVAYKVSPLLGGLDDQFAFSRVSYGDKPHYLSLQSMRDEDRARAILSTKSLKWAYEREWRLFAPQPGFAEHGPGVVATVYLGMRMDESDQEAITQRMHAAKIAVRRTSVDGYTLSCSSPLQQK